MAILATDYYKLLKDIQNNHVRVASEGLPYDSDTFYVNLASREIEIPVAYQDFISVTTDHRAEALNFAVDRYFDGIDLANTTIVIEYVNALGESRIYPVTVFDFTNPDYILFEWAIGGEATKPNGRENGTIKFAVRFYTVDQSRSIFTYNLNTLPATGTILFGMDKPDESEWYQYPDTAIEEVYSRLEEVAKDKQILWVDVP